MIKGCTFIIGRNTFHTGTDLDLVQERKDIGRPEIQSYHVLVPARNGLVNLTSSLAGRVTYANRQIELQYFSTGSQRQETIDTLSEMHGMEVKMIDDDTPDYYYEGECSIEVIHEYAYDQIIVRLDAQPFRYSTYKHTNYFNLTEDVREIYIHNNGYDVVPIIEVTDRAKIESEEYSVTYDRGVYEALDLELKRGANKFIISGVGRIAIEYREAVI